MSITSNMFNSLLIKLIYGAKKTVMNVLTKYGAHPSTQHNNERLAKTSSRMARTRKNEQNTNYYLIAANGFISKGYKT